MQLIGARGAATSAYFQGQLALLGEHPLVGQTRGIGMLGAIELVHDKTTKARYQPDGIAGGTCRNICFDNGVIMRAVGDTMFLSPPLVITPEEIDDPMSSEREQLTPWFVMEWHELRGTHRKAFDAFMTDISGDVAA